MSHLPSDPLSTPHADPMPASQRASFILRLSRSPGDGGWRCHLIYVETGQRLPCTHLGEVGDQIEAWLQEVERGKGLR
jgi:hypothetical protein